MTADTRSETSKLGDQLMTRPDVKFVPTFAQALSNPWAYRPVQIFGGWKVERDAQAATIAELREALEALLRDEKLDDDDARLVASRNQAITAIAKATT